MHIKFSQNVLTFDWNVLLGCVEPRVRALLLQCDLTTALHIIQCTQINIITINHKSMPFFANFSICVSICANGRA